MRTLDVQFCTPDAHLDAGAPGVVGGVGLVSRVGQARQPADVGLGAWPLSKPNSVPGIIVIIILLKTVK